MNIADWGRSSYRCVGEQSEQGNQRQNSNFSPLFVLERLSSGLHLFFHFVGSAPESRQVLMLHGITQTRSETGISKRPTSPWWHLIGHTRQS